MADGEGGGGFGIGGVFYEIGADGFPLEAELAHIRDVARAYGGEIGRETDKIGARLDAQQAAARRLANALAAVGLSQDEINTRVQRFTGLDAAKVIDATTAALSGQEKQARLTGEALDELRAQQRAQAEAEQEAMLKRRRSLDEIRQRSSTAAVQGRIAGLNLNDSFDERRLKAQQRFIETGEDMERAMLGVVRIGKVYHDTLAGDTKVLMELASAVNVENAQQRELQRGFDEAGLAAYREAKSLEALNERSKQSVIAARELAAVQKDLRTVTVGKEIWKVDASTNAALLSHAAALGRIRGEEDALQSRFDSVTQAARRQQQAFENMKPENAALRLALLQGRVPQSQFEAHRNPPPASGPPSSTQGPPAPTTPPQAGPGGSSQRPPAPRPGTNGTVGQDGFTPAERAALRVTEPAVFRYRPAAATPPTATGARLDATLAAQAALAPSRPTTSRTASRRLTTLTTGQDIRTLPDDEVEAIARGSLGGVQSFPNVHIASIERAKREGDRRRGLSLARDLRRRIDDGTYSQPGFQPDSYSDPFVRRQRGPFRETLRRQHEALSAFQRHGAGRIDQRFIDTLLDPSAVITHDERQALTAEAERRARGGAFILPPVVGRTPLTPGARALPRRPLPYPLSRRLAHTESGEYIPALSDEELHERRVAASSTNGDGLLLAAERLRRNADASAIAGDTAAVRRQRASAARAIREFRANANAGIYGNRLDPGSEAVRDYRSRLAPPPVEAPPHPFTETSATEALSQLAQRAKTGTEPLGPVTPVGQPSSDLYGGAFGGFHHLDIEDQRARRHEIEDVPTDVAYSLLHRSLRRSSTESSHHTPATYAALRESIRRNGIQEEIIGQANPDTGEATIVEGTHRLSIARELGLPTVPMRFQRRGRLQYPGRIVAGSPLLTHQGHVPEELRPSQVLPASAFGQPDIDALSPILAGLPDYALEAARSIEYAHSQDELQSLLGSDHASAGGLVLGHEQKGHIRLSPELASRPVESRFGQKGQQEVLVHELAHALFGQIGPEGRRLYEQVARGSAPTEYGKTSLAEDFAEATRGFLVGGIDTETGKPIELDEGRAAFMQNLSALAQRGQRYPSYSEHSPKALLGELDALQEGASQYHGPDRFPSQGAGRALLDDSHRRNRTGAVLGLDALDSHLERNFDVEGGKGLYEGPLEHGYRVVQKGPTAWCIQDEARHVVAEFKSQYQAEDAVRHLRERWWNLHKPVEGTNLSQTDYAFDQRNISDLAQRSADYAEAATLSEAGKPVAAHLAAGIKGDAYGVGSDAHKYRYRANEFADYAETHRRRLAASTVDGAPTAEAAASPPTQARGPIKPLLSPGQAREIKVARPGELIDGHRLVEQPDGGYTVEDEHGQTLFQFDSAQHATTFLNGFRSRYRELHSTVTGGVAFDSTTSARSYLRQIEETETQAAGVENEAARVAGGAPINPVYADVLGDERLGNGPNEQRLRGFAHGLRLQASVGRHYYGASTINGKSAKDAVGQDSLLGYEAPAATGEGVPTLGPDAPDSLFIGYQPPTGTGTGAPTLGPDTTPSTLPAAIGDQNSLLNYVAPAATGKGIPTPPVEPPSLLIGYQPPTGTGTGIPIQTIEPPSLLIGYQPPTGTRGATPPSPPPSAAATAAAMAKYAKTNLPHATPGPRSVAMTQAEALEVLANARAEAASLAAEASHAEDAVQAQREGQATVYKPGTLVPGKTDQYWIEVAKALGTSAFDPDWYNLYIGRNATSGKIEVLGEFTRAMDVTPAAAGHGYESRSSAEQRLTSLKNRAGHASEYARLTEAHLAAGGTLYHPDTSELPWDLTDEAPAAAEVAPPKNSPEAIAAANKARDAANQAEARHLADLREKNMADARRLEAAHKAAGVPPTNPDGTPYRPESAKPARTRARGAAGGGSLDPVDAAAAGFLHADRKLGRKGEFAASKVIKGENAQAITLRTPDGDTVTAYWTKAQQAQFASLTADARATLSQQAALNATEQAAHAQGLAAERPYAPPLGPGELDAQEQAAHLQSLTAEFTPAAGGAGGVPPVEPPAPPATPPEEPEEAGPKRGASMNPRAAYAAGFGLSFQKQNRDGTNAPGRVRGNDVVYPITLTGADGNSVVVHWTKEQHDEFLSLNGKEREQARQRQAAAEAEKEAERKRLEEAEYERQHPKHTPPPGKDLVKLPPPTPTGPPDPAREELRQRLGKLRRAAQLADVAVQRGAVTHRQGARANLVEITEAQSQLSAAEDARAANEANRNFNFPENSPGSRNAQFALKLLAAGATDEQAAASVQEHGKVNKHDAQIAVAAARPHLQRKVPFAPTPANVDALTKATREQAFTSILSGSQQRNRISDFINPDARGIPTAVRLRGGTDIALSHEEQAAIHGLRRQAQNAQTPEALQPHLEKIGPLVEQIEARLSTLAEALADGTRKIEDNLQDAANAGAAPHESLAQSTHAAAEQLAQQQRRVLVTLPSGAVAEFVPGGDNTKLFEQGKKEQEALDIQDAGQRLLNFNNSGQKESDLSRGERKALEHARHKLAGTEDEEAPPPSIGQRVKSFAKDAFNVTPGNLLRFGTQLLGVGLGLSILSSIGSIIHDLIASVVTNSVQQVSRTRLAQRSNVTSFGVEASGDQAAGNAAQRNPNLFTSPDTFQSNLQNARLQLRPLGLSEADIKTTVEQAAQIRNLHPQIEESAAGGAIATALKGDTSGLVALGFPGLTEEEIARTAGKSTTEFRALPQFERTKLIQTAIAKSLAQQQKNSDDNKGKSPLTEAQIAATKAKTEAATHIGEALEGPAALTEKVLAAPAGAVNNLAGADKDVANGIRNRAITGAAELFLPGGQIKGATELGAALLGAIGVKPTTPPPAEGAAAGTSTTPTEEAKTDAARAEAQAQKDREFADATAQNALLATLPIPGAQAFARQRQDEATAQHNAPLDLEKFAAQNPESKAAEDAKKAAAAAETALTDARTRATSRANELTDQTGKLVTEQQQLILSSSQSADELGGLADAIEADLTNVSRARQTAARVNQAAQVQDALAAGHQALAEGVVGPGGLLNLSPEAAQARAEELASQRVREEEATLTKRKGVGTLQQEIDDTLGNPNSTADQVQAATERQAKLNQQRAASDRAVSASKAQALAQRGAAEAAALQSSIDLRDRQRRLDAAPAVRLNEIERIGLEAESAPLQIEGLRLQQQTTVASRSDLGLDRNVLNARQAALPATRHLEDLQFNEQLTLAQATAARAQIRLHQGDPEANRAIIRGAHQDIRQQTLERLANAEVPALQAQHAVTLAQRPQEDFGITQQKTLLDLEQKRRDLEDKTAPLDLRLAINQAIAAEIERGLTLASHADDIYKDIAEQQQIAAGFLQIAADEAQRQADDYANSWTTARDIIKEIAQNLVDIGAIAPPTTPPSTGAVPPITGANLPNLPSSAGQAANGVNVHVDGGQVMVGDITIASDADIERVVAQVAAAGGANAQRQATLLRARLKAELIRAQSSSRVRSPVLP